MQPRQLKQITLRKIVKLHFEYTNSLPENSPAKQALLRILELFIERQNAQEPDLSKKIDDTILVNLSAILRPNLDDQSALTQIYRQHQQPYPASFKTLDHNKLKHLYDSFIRDFLKDLLSLSADLEITGVEEKGKEEKEKKHAREQQHDELIKDAFSAFSCLLHTETVQTDPIISRTRERLYATIESPAEAKETGNTQNLYIFRFTLFAKLIKQNSEHLISLCQNNEAKLFINLVSKLTDNDTYTSLYLRLRENIQRLRKTPESGMARSHTVPVSGSHAMPPPPPGFGRKKR